MAWEVPILDITQIAGADLTASQYRFVANQADGIVTVDTEGAVSLGVLQNDPESGQSAGVRVAGVTKIVAGAAIAVGDQIATDNQGRAITAVADSGNNVHGIALDAAVAEGEIITMLIRPNGII